MGKGRLEAFSDGVIAIITIMALELKVPHGEYPGAVLWSNLHLLFWLSLMPFTTGWMGENHFAPLPVSIYGRRAADVGGRLFILVRALIASHGRDSEFASRIGTDWKGQIPLVVYAAAILLAFVNVWISLALYAGIAALWFVPDRRFEPGAPQAGH